MIRLLAITSTRGWLWEIVSTRQGRIGGLISAVCLLLAYSIARRRIKREDAMPESKKRRGFSAEELAELQNEGTITEDERLRIEEALDKPTGISAPQRVWNREFPKAGLVADLFKRRAIYCPKCGYDLRATPERCPECGTVFVKQAPRGL
jgi:rubrerythrin